MKYLSWILLGPVLIWALVATYQVVQLKKSPVVLSVLPDGSNDEFQNLGQVERISFIRQFVDRYTSFEHDNFWQSQVALSFLMAPEMRDQRLAEVNRLKEKINKNLTDQKGRVVSIEQIGKDHYRVAATINLLENKSHALLGATIDMKLSDNPRSLDNPWGLVVSRFKIGIEPKKNEVFKETLAMKKGLPTVLAFPCAVENFEIPDSQILRVKITTFNVSEIQLYALQDTIPEMSLKALCKDREYSLKVAGGEKQTDLFLSVPESHGKNRQRMTRKKAGRNPYQKTIENELGFVIEE